MRRSPFGHYILVGIIAFVLGGAGGVFAAGTIPGPGGVITACFRVQTDSSRTSGDDGQLRLVASADECGKNERAISWNQVGPKGDTGAVGVKGDKGDTGSTGATAAT